MGLAVCWRWSAVRAGEAGDCGLLFVAFWCDWSELREWAAFWYVAAEAEEAWADGMPTEVNARPFDEQGGAGRGGLCKGGTKPSAGWCH